ncbi:MAG: leucine-rich repeat domain-containing protein [Holosporales bacterium]|nr:leucine-rich repeat domain-containing protein [Holosporales bacterium]
MKNVIMIVSVIMLLVPEIAYCTRAIDRCRQNLDGVCYFANKDGITIASSNRSSNSPFPRNLICKNGQVSPTLYVGSFDGSRFALICISSSVQTFGNGCFGNCPNLSIVAFESNSQLTRISDHAFRSCSSLKSVCFPASLQTIGGNCFKECRSLSCVTFALGSRLARLPECTFDGCSSLRSICIPSSLQAIGNWCFQDCGSLSILMFESVPRLQIIGAGAFSGSALESICLPSSLRTIGGGCFLLCRNLSVVEFEPGSKLRTIEDFAFGDCAALKSICIPSSVERLGPRCFGSTPLTTRLNPTAGLSSIVFEPSPQPITIGKDTIPAGVTIDANDRPLVRR